MEEKKNILAFLKHLQLLGFQFIPLQRQNSDERERELEKLRLEVLQCKACPLHKTRKKPVVGEGNPRAILVFIGEAPGAEEDEQGRPFVGKAGELLTKIIKAMGLERKEVYITNVLKCRPPGNRNPRPEEIKACWPFLERQIEIIKPKLICTLGTFATQTFLGTQQKITFQRGSFKEWRGIKVLPTFHPAFLLRNPQYKRLAWEDIKKLMVEFQKLKGQGV
jgi:DNA polymerase